MKSHHKYRFWFISLVVHLCLAVVFSIIVINQTIPNDVDALDVSIFKAEPVPLAQRIPNVEAPTAAPTPMPDFQIQSQLASARNRALTTRQVKSTFVSVPKTVAVNALVTQSPAQSARAKISVQGASRSSRVNHQPAQLLATAVDLPVQSDAPLAAGMSGGGSLSGSGVGEGSGSGVGRGAFGLGASTDQAPTRGSAGLTSLVGTKGTANIDDTLSDVTEKVTLGGEVPELSPGVPGAIIVGRGRDIVGRLNLARFEDPLHPSADI